MKVLKRLLQGLTPLNELGFLGFSNGQFRIPGTTYKVDPANSLNANAAQTLAVAAARGFVGKGSDPGSAPRLRRPMEDAIVRTPVGQTPGQNTGGGGGGGGGGYGGGGADPAVAQQQRTNQAIGMRGMVSDRARAVIGIYDALYGDLDAATADKSNQINTRYNQDEGALTGQFNEQFPLIGNAYAGRGTYDSSYRIDKEEGAKGAYGSSVQKLAQGRDDDLSEVGKYAATERANFGAQQANLRSVVDQINQSENPDELTQLQNTLSERINSLQASRAGLQSRSGYLNTLNQRLPEGTRISGIQTSLGNVIKSAVPGPVKKQIAGQIVANSGLSGDSAARLLADINAQIDNEDRVEVQPAQAVAA